MCVSALPGTDGISPSLDAFDWRGELMIDKGWPGDRKKLDRWFSSIGLGEHSIDEVSGVVSREEARDPRELSE